MHEGAWHQAWSEFSLQNPHDGRREPAPCACRGAHPPPKISKCKKKKKIRYKPNCQMLTGCWPQFFSMALEGVFLCIRIGVGLLASVRALSIHGCPGTCCAAQGSLELAVPSCLSLLSTAVAALCHQIHYKGDAWTACGATFTEWKQTQRVQRQPSSLLGIQRTASGSFSDIVPVIKSMFLNGLLAVAHAIMYRQCTAFYKGARDLNSSLHAYLLSHLPNTLILICFFFLF